MKVLCPYVIFSYYCEDKLKHMQFVLIFLKTFYRLLLFPIVLQLFLNPGTLFYKEREKFGIKPEISHREFREANAVYVDGSEEEYNLGAYNYAKEKCEEHPEIKWKIFFRARTLKSAGSSCNRRA